MTEEMMNLRTLLEKSSDARAAAGDGWLCCAAFDGARGRGLTGAAHGARSESRVNHRNGYRDRMWETRAGVKPSAPSRHR
jgi:putative transposase